MHAILLAMSLVSAAPDWGGILQDRNSQPTLRTTKTPWEEKAQVDARAAMLNQYRANRELERMGLTQADLSDPKKVAAAKKRWREWNVFQRAQERAESRGR